MLRAFLAADAGKSVGWNPSNIESALASLRE
jgi:hypothetical protein